MSAPLQPRTSDDTENSLSRSEQCAAMHSSGAQLTGPESGRPRCGTNNTFDSISTIVDYEKHGKVVDAQKLEPQLSAGDSISSHPLSVVVNEKAQPIRERDSPGLWQRFCLRWLTAYRALISVVVMLNLGLLVAHLVLNPTVESSLRATSANVMAAALSRQEELINTSFKLISKLPPNLPLSVRKTIGDFHHYGGVHIGCALSALLWYILFTVLNTVRVLSLLSLSQMTTMLYIDIVTAYAILIAILTVCLTAVPRFRIHFHNTFEVTHRFGGWAALLVLWIHAGITTRAPDASTPLYAHASLWLLALTTLLLISPWLRIRSVPITPCPLSAREIQLTFSHTLMPYTSTVRFSTSPLMEWHAFATIPVTSTTAKVIVSKAGDWTTSIVSSPPTHLWIRNPPTRNFLTFAPLFNSLVLVATGAGIAPMLSLLVSPAIARMKAERRNVRIMWCVADPWAPHWTLVVDAILSVDAAATIFDTKVARPDVAFEARWLAQKEGAEAVMVVSNPKVTKEVVNECKLSGLAAYGAVFDS